MADLLNITNSVLDATSGVSKVFDDYQTKQANFSTQTKSIQLARDIDDQLARIRQSSPTEFKDWNTQINNFFEQVKSGMGDKNSPYYCKNNLQATEFQKILDQNQVNVSDQVNKLVEQQQIQKNRIDVNKAILNLQESGLSGQQFYDAAKEVINSAYAVGTYSQDEYEKLLDNIFYTGYTNMYENMFNETVGESIERGDSFETIWDMMQQYGSLMMKTDGDNMPVAFDKKAYDQQIKKTLQQSYNAKLADVQNANAGKLSELVQKMRQQETAEGKLSVARQGFNAMNSMKGIQLSTSQRDHYSDIFEFMLKTSGSGTGSGSGNVKKSDFDSFEKFMKAAPETMVQLVKDGTLGNYYDGVKLGALTLQDEWFNGNYQENYDKDAAERNETFNLVYKASTSEDTLSSKIFNLLLENYPTAKDLVKSDYNKLIEDIKKNPDKYGTATVGALSEWMMDTLMGADANYTDDDFAKDFKNHINDCYAQSIDYVVLDKKGNLEKKYNAKLPGDIAKAARLAQEKDFVYTWNGNERWATGKKEALEAEGGIVDVLKNAVAGTLGLTEDDIKSNPIGFYYKPDAAHDDLTSTPIITYKGKGYEVIPDEGDTGFKLRVINPGVETIEKDGKLYEVIRHSNGYERLKEVEYIDGKTGVKELKLQRDQEKKTAKEQEKAAAQNTATIQKEREEASNKKIMETKETPTAITKSNKLDDENEWNWANDIESKKSILRRVVSAIKKDADNVNTGKQGSISKTYFMNKYNISYDEWIKDKEETRLFDLILNS